MRAVVNLVLTAAGLLVLAYLLFGAGVLGLLYAYASMMRSVLG